MPPPLLPCLSLLHSLWSLMATLWPGDSSHQVSVMASRSLCSSATVASSPCLLPLLCALGCQLCHLLRAITLDSSEIFQCCLCLDFCHLRSPWLIFWRLRVHCRVASISQCILIRFHNKEEGNFCSTVVTAIVYWTINDFNEVRSGKWLGVDGQCIVEFMWIKLFF